MHGECQDAEANSLPFLILAVIREFTLILV